MEIGIRQLQVLKTDADMTNSTEVTKANEPGHVRINMQQHVVLKPSLSLSVSVSVFVSLGSLSLSLSLSLPRGIKA